MYRLKMIYTENGIFLNGGSKSTKSYKCKCDTKDECKQLINALFQEVSNLDIEGIIITINNDNGDEE